ncbi:MAG: transposase [Pyrinomonadaceae bacterium]
MKRDYIEFQERSQPLGYLITIRCYGTWLHGDVRGSMDRRAYNKSGEPRRPVNRHLEKRDRGYLKNPPMLFDAIRRKHVEAAIREVCSIRGIALIAINVRTNHVHVLIATNGLPEPIMNSFKAYATRRLRQEGFVGIGEKVWSRHGSTRYLWTEEHMGTALEYVVNGQGDELPKFE